MLTCLNTGQRGVEREIECSTHLVNHTPFRRSGITSRRKPRRQLRERRGNILRQPQVGRHRLEPFRYRRMGRVLLAVRPAHPKAQAYGAKDNDGEGDQEGDMEEVNAVAHEDGDVVMSAGVGKVELAVATVLG